MLHLTLGSIRVDVLLDGTLSIEPERMVGSNPLPGFRDALDVQSDGLLHIPVHCVLVRTNGRTILLDGGTGADDPPSFEGRFVGLAGNLVSELRRIGVEPERVDTVVMSHCHGDHAGGLVTTSGGEARPTYPHATYVMADVELSFATHEDRRELQPDVYSKLSTLRDQASIMTIDAPTELCPGVSVAIAGGHTPGHLYVDIGEGVERLRYSGDLIHQACQFEHPEWSPGFDLDPALSATSRRALLDACKSEGFRILTAHCPSPGLVRWSASRGWLFGEDAL
jgi:glyoxylase-like metal-dependent hydrolase (beta-lactamase superfamily II)